MLINPKKKKQKWAKEVKNRLVYDEWIGNNPFPMVSIGPYERNSQPQYAPTLVDSVQKVQSRGAWQALCYTQ